MYVTFVTEQKIVGPVNSAKYKDFTSPFSCMIFVI